MARIGVMPMPPAKRSERRACTSSGNLLRGSLISSVSPTCTRSCRAFEPPRELDSFSTPPSVRWTSKLRTSSASTRRSMTRTSSTLHPVLEDDGLAAEPRLDHPFGEAAVHRIGVLRKPTRQLESEGACHAQLACGDERLHLVH